jgi:hypothetical protein
MDRCARCGQPLSEAAERFCVHCGAKIEPPRPAYLWPLVAVGGVAALLIAVAIVFLVVRPGNTRYPGSPVSEETETSSELSQEPGYTTETTTTETTTSSDTWTTSEEVPADPADVVLAFYDAINDQDYETAWNLGGHNLTETFEKFSDGFANTLHDDVTVTSVSGDTVSVDLLTSETGGVSHEYTGSYTVEDGEIVAGSMKRVN